MHSVTKACQNNLAPSSPICDSYVRPMTLVRICDDCSCQYTGTPPPLHSCTKAIFTHKISLAIPFLKQSDPTPVDVSYAAHMEFPTHTIAQNVLGWKRTGTDVPRL